MGSSEELDFYAGANYEAQVVAQTLLRNSLVYQPYVKTGNCICLQTIQNIVHLTASPHLKHVLVIAPTKEMVSYLHLFLKRHLCTSSIEPWFGPYSSEHTELSDVMFGSIAEHLWSKIIVSTFSAISSLFSYGLEISHLALIVIYDCSNFFNDSHLSKVIKSVESAEIQPRILCFASCFGDNCLGTEEMISSVVKLQEFYHSSLATVSDISALARIVPYTSDSFCPYKKFEVTGQSCKDVLQELSEVLEQCRGFDFHLNDRVNKIWSKTPLSHQNVPDTLLDIQHHMEEFGEYGGSVSTLVALQNLIAFNTFTDDSVNQFTKHMLNYLICCVSKMRKILEEDMFRVQKCERIERFSSDKIQSLLRLLKKMQEGERAVIIMSNPHSACILTTILQNWVKLAKNIPHLRPESILNGSGIPLSEAWHDLLTYERNMEVYSRFVALKTNVVVLSGELQGLDLPESDIVFVMETIDQFSQFVHLKKFVKSGSGKFVLFCDQSNTTSYEEQIKCFQAMEKKMREVLITNAQSGADIDFHYEYGPTTRRTSLSTASGDVLTLENSISVLNKFCSQLSMDLFSYHQPLWSMQEVQDSPLSMEVTVTLHLPRILPNKKITGVKAKSFEAAKSIAAYQACKELNLGHELKEVSDLPSTAYQGNELRSAVDENHVDEYLSNIVYPNAFSRAQPLPGVKSFIHEIRMCPVSPPPLPGDNRKTVLYDLLCDRRCFAIFSAKPLPKVCSFPVFVYGHEMRVDVRTVHKEVVFSKEEFSYLRTFHAGIFLYVVPLVQCFMQFDVLNRENSYLIAPLTAEGEIDWETIKNHSSIPIVTTLTPEERADLECTTETHERKMVVPWYRPLPSHQVYLVASVCEDMCADSCFPTDDYESFTEYYLARYAIELMRPELPLLEVYLVNTKINGLLPRTNCRKLRREEKMEDFREHMVPELCQLLLFPSSLWLKLASLPSVLHRLSRLLVMDDVRRQIYLETEVGDLDKEWHSFSVDQFSPIEEIVPSSIAPSTVKRGLVIGNVKLQERKRETRSKKPWGTIQEPMDIDRQIEALNELEIRYFQEFILKDPSSSHQVLNEKASESTNQDICEDQLKETSMDVCVDENEIHINLLNTNRMGCGPQLHELLEAFTSASSTDVVNMNRLCVLGNAFLTFIVSVYLYEMNPMAMAHKLCHQQKEFLRRERLADCASEKNLIGCIKIFEFSPGDWTPPCFATPHMLKQVLIDQHISPSVLPRITLNESEQMAGFLSEDSQEEILEILTEYVCRGISKREETFIDRQYVTVDTASNCVEALIGAYFKSCSWDGALKVIDWLGLFPSGNFQGLLNCEGRHMSQLKPSSLSHRLATLEIVLHYDFHDKHLLVEAVTHSSYVNPFLAGCMDRLVFLGRAVLDIVLTAYIFEKCGHLTPSKLSSLRAALLSSSTLAALAVRQDLHKYLLMSSSSLLNAVDRFVQHQVKNQHQISDEVLLLIEEHECENPHQVELPTVLCDLLPSLVGAIYLDAGKNLLFVWNIIQNIFIPQINIWKDNVPLSVVDLLMDLSPAAHQVIFSTPTVQPGGVQITCTLQVDNTREEVFHALGADEMKAKTFAAKLALRALLGSPEASIEL